MLRSLYSGVSGLKTHQVKMDVIGNNIANVNTVAYKSQSITFSELMYQTTQKASGPNEATGTAGTNAKQIGLGVTSGAISTAITSQGSTQTTGNAFDLKITGESFFVVSDGTTNYFTRDGSFYVDAAGNLAMSSNGYNVMGWLPVEDKDTGEINIQQDTVQKLQILSAANLTSAPKATTKATVTGILDKNDPNVTSAEGKAMSLSFYDNLGYSYTAKLAINDTDDEGAYILSLKDVLDSNNDSVLGKFNATIFTGNNADGASAYAKKSASYTLLDGYAFDASTGKITLPTAISVEGSDVSEIVPGDFLNNDGTLKTDPGTATLANAYAEAFGFDNAADMFNLTVRTWDNTAGAEVQVSVASLLTSSPIGQYNGIIDDTTDPYTTGTMNLFDTSGKVMTVDGYVEPAGSAVKIVYDQASGKFVGINGSDKIQSFNLFLSPKEGNENPFETVEIDMSDSLNYNNERTSTIGATSGDDKGYGTGCALGNMTGVSIQNNGMIYGAYDNGQTKLLGQIAVANFSNAAGLEKQGDNLYSATLNSGEFDGIGVDVSSDGGYIQTGVLEMSNVDLSSEFTELITTQRGFQANSRIITVSDTLLDELVNLKR